MKSRSSHMAPWVVLVCLLALLGAAQAQLPAVERVEPPNWWIGMPDPMVMITGEHLPGVQTSTRPPGIRVARTLDGLGGRYEFVWLEISKAALPGKIDLDLATETGRTQLSLPLEGRDPAWENASDGRGFNGFGPDDVIYLIMPDRFADGDPNNNFPGSGAYDRNLPRAYHGGDLRGIQQRLAYLKDLGVTTIWITP